MVVDRKYFETNNGLNPRAKMNLKSVKILVLPIVLIFSGLGFSATNDFQSLEGCQGEGCGCTSETKANKEFSLYSEMNLKSKLLGKYKVGTEAKALKVTTKVVDPGQSTVQAVQDPKVGLKSGDEVNHVFYLGEGVSKAMRHGKWLEFENEKVQLSSIKKPVYEEWFEIQVGKNHGYAPIFPFLGCLE